MTSHHTSQPSSRISQYHRQSAQPSVSHTVSSVTTSYYCRHHQLLLQSSRQPVSYSVHHPHLQPARVAPYALPMVRAHHMSRETVAPTSDIAPIIVVASSRPLTTPRHTRDSQLDPVCTMTRILNNPTRSVPSVLSLLVGLSVPFLGRSRAHLRPPALRRGIAHTLHHHNIGFALHQLPAHRASSVTNVTRAVSSNTSITRSTLSPAPRGQHCHQYHAVNSFASASRSTQSLVTRSLRFDFVRLLLDRVVVSRPLRHLPYQSSTSQPRVLTS